MKFRRALSSLRASLYRVPSRRFWFNVGLGGGISVFLIVLESTKPIEALNNLAIDPMMRIEAISTERVPNNIIFVDLSEANEVAASKHVGTMHRSLLAHTIQTLVAHRAGIIVVDMILSGPDCCDEQGDDSLRHVLSSLPASTKVIFACESDATTGQRLPLTIDSFIDNNPHVFFRTYPVFKSLGSDMTIRYMTPHVDSSNGKGAAFSIPTVPYMVDSIKHGVFDMQHKDIERIRFRLYPAEVLNSEGTLSTPLGSLKLPASMIDKLSETTSIDDSTIAIVGQSDPNLGDVHLTPIGNLAGMYVLGNAINTILYDPAQKEGGFVQWTIELFPILIAAALFAIHKPLKAQLLTVLILIVVLIPFTILLFLYCNIFVNPIIPVLGISLHRIYAQWEQEFEHHRKEVAL